MGNFYQTLVFVDKLRALRRGTPFSQVEDLLRSYSVKANNNAGVYKVTMRTLLQRLKLITEDMKEKLGSMREKNILEDYYSIKSDRKQFDLLRTEGGKSKREYVEKQADFFRNWPDIARDRISSRDHSRLSTYVQIRDKLIRETSEPLKEVDRLEAKAKSILAEADREYNQRRQRGQF